MRHCVSVLGVCELGVCFIDLCAYVCARNSVALTLVELERILALVTLIDHEVFCSGSDGFAARCHRTSLRESLDVTIRAERRSILNAEIMVIQKREFPGT